MSVTNLVVSQTYSGNGSTTSFAIPFTYFTASQVAVTIYDTVAKTTTALVNGVGFTIVGSNVVTTATYGSTITITVARVTAFQQTFDFINNTTVNQETIEQALDYILMMAQEVNAKKVIELPKEFTGVFSPVLPHGIATANVALVTNATGNGWAVGPSIADITSAQQFALDAEAAKVAAQNAQAAAETARAGAELAETNAETAQAAAEAAQLAAETAETNAETAETNAEAAQAAAEAAQLAAETAQTAAELAETNAETAETNAETAQGLAEAARDAALTAQTNAETAETNAETAQAAAEAAQAAAEAAAAAIPYIGDAHGDSLVIGGLTPVASAIGEFISTTKGFLFPRMTEAQRDAIATPATGLIVFNLDSNDINFYNGSAWKRLSLMGGIAVQQLFNDYTITNVTTGAYVQLTASTTAKASRVEIFDSSGETMILAVGGAGSEVDQFYIIPGGNGSVGIDIPAGSRISLKGKTGTATEGYVAINLFN